LPRQKTRFGETGQPPGHCLLAIWLFASFVLPVLVVLLLFAAPANAKTIDFSVRPVAFGTPEMPAKLGRLTLLSAHQLFSEDSRFGGFSGLRFLANGAKLLSVSDKGRAMILSVTRSATGAITGLKMSDFFALRDRKLARLSRKRFHGDAESLAHGPGTSLLVGFEGQDRILSFSKTTLRGPGKLFLGRKKMPKMGLNSGLETLLRLPNGSHFAISEQFSQRHSGFRGFRLMAGQLSGFTYRTEAGYRPVDGMALANGNVLILERLFHWPFIIGSRIVEVAAKSVLAKVITGVEVARWDAERIGDNFEGLAVVQWRGKTLVHVISDDNFNFFQGTYLLTFRLD
jgi:hypothetical protein